MKTTIIKHYSFLFCLSVAHSLGFTLNAQEVADTIHSHSLKEVEVKARPQSSAYLATSSLQTLSANQLGKINALQVSDAVKYFSGVQVKDYGGVGGLKTVSIRSLGANYTHVAYDGITVSDYQTGQIDLGRFSLDNVEQIKLTIGESDDIFQPARTKALGGVIQIITPSFSLPAHKKNEIKASFQTGSFGLFHPSFLFKQALNPTFTLSISTEYLKAKGDYPFTQVYGYPGDSISHEKRNNSDVESGRLETNLAGKFVNGGKLLFKAYYFTSGRGIPGPSIYYNEYAGERIKDRNFFSQATYTQPLSEKLDFQANAKFNYAYMDYIDINVKYPTDGKFQAFYYQREYYLNAVFLYKLSEYWSFSWANDGIYGDFSNNFRNCSFPSRTQWLSLFSGKYERNNFTWTAGLLNTYVDEAVKIGIANKNSNHLSPYIGISVKPLTPFPVRIRAYYKNTYRLPTFGDMYYSTLPNPNLKAENAHQYDVGLTFIKSLGDWLSYVSFSGDVYYYRIENKIFAWPKSSMALWSVENYGKVDIRGMDLNLEVHSKVNNWLSAQIKGTYTCQNVLDKTDSSTRLYNQQLPYTPRHSATVFASLSTPWVDFNYNLIYSGKRYYYQINLPEYQLKAFADQGISFTKDMQWGKYRLNLSAECLNIFNEQYDVVRSYPMPGRSYRFGIKFIY